MIDRPNLRRHILCPACWEKRNPGRTPIVVKGVEPEPCCECGRSFPPIYVRDEPRAFACRGQHDG